MAFASSRVFGLRAGPRGGCVVCQAKKKKKGGGAKRKGSAAKKQSPVGSQVAEPFRSLPVVTDLLCCVESYSSKLQQPLVPAGTEITNIADVIWEAPFVLLFHRLTSPPTFCYLNRAGLALFETTWDAFVGTESSKTAEDDADVQRERDAYLAKGLEKGFVRGIDAWRVSQKGKRFLIKDATLWNVQNSDGEIFGQAALIKSWEYEDGSAGDVASLFAKAEEIAGTSSGGDEEG